MGELKRILLDETSPLERRMLQGGAREQPTLRTRRRIAQALGLSPLIAYSSAAKALLSSLWVQAGLGIALAAGVTALGASDTPPSELASSADLQEATVEVATSVEEQKPSPAPVALERQSKSSATIVAEPPLERSRHTPPVSTKRATSKPAKSKLGLEISLIDRARTLIAHGRADRALLVLDKYRSNFPRGVLAPEAELLRRRALQ